MKRILAIDGGGIKGVFPASILAELDAHCEHDIRSYFDLIVGTSTGGILALGLGLGRSPGQLLDMYRTKGPAIFGQGNHRLIDAALGQFRSFRSVAFGPKYRNDKLKDALTQELKEAKLGHSLNRLVITSYDFEAGEVRLDKTSHHPNLLIDYNKRAVDVAMATAAAPTFFQPYVCSDGISLIDGGVWANNPVAVAAAEAHYLGWQAEEVRILSLGTTRSRPPSEANSGALRMARKGWVSHMFMDAQSSAALKFARVMTQRDETVQSIWRVDWSAPQGWPTRFVSPAVSR